jgi:hypothetical protein
MLSVNVYVTNLSAERLWDVAKPMPPQVHINVNINILGFEGRSDVTAEAPFVFTVNFVPSIAQISIKGRAHINGDAGEIKKILDESKQQKPPPMAIVQAVSNASMAEAILLSKTLNIPPPLPPLPAQQQVQSTKAPEMRYTT